jgi:DNA-binding FadR family transcriptional regulator
LITVEDGKGAYVLSPTPEESIRALSRYVARLDIKESYDPLYEIRLMIEPDLASLAAKRADKEHISELRTSVENLRAAQNDPEKWIEADLGFHNVIAQASKNPYAVVFMEILLEHMDFLVGSGFLLEGAIEATIEIHEQIYECILNGKADDASQKMREHILDSKERIAATLKDLHQAQVMRESGK